MADRTPDINTHQRVVETVRAIPEGFVRTYGDVSPGAPHFTGTVLRRESIYASAGFRTSLGA